MSTVRTRFAPSPTGFMHVGGLRTALFAWLVARQNNGQFVLRIEDTDRDREVSGSDQHIIDSLKSLGLDYDEGPDIGGHYGPYRQSQRLDIYHEWAEKLINKGRAYADPYSADELQKLRDQAKASKKPFLYRDNRPDRNPIWAVGQPLRFKSEPKAYSWLDSVMGPKQAGEEAIDDFIIIKSDGYPTYNFAHIVDDYLMKMTHVIRSQEFLASVPKYLNLYEALEIDQPLLATVPFVMGPDGNKKLSKRDGARDVADYTRQGFLESTLLNFMATLGWNDGTKQEIFSVDELIAKFSLSRVQISGARFDEQRLIWMNGVHIRQLTLDELYGRCSTFWPPEAENFDKTYKRQVLLLLQQRLKYLAELPELSSFFFVDQPLNYSLIAEHKQLKTMAKSELLNLLVVSREALRSSDFDSHELQAKLNALLDTTDQKPAVLFSLIRIAITQVAASPDLAGTLSVLGKDKSLSRLDTQIAALS